MKKLFLIALLSFLSFPKFAGAQSFDDNSDVVVYMENRTFYNSDNGMQIELKFLSSYNTYALVFTNRYNTSFDFINVTVSPYGAFADISAMRADDGSAVELRLYKGRLVAGAGSSDQQTYYLK